MNVAGAPLVPNALFERDGYASPVSCKQQAALVRVSDPLSIIECERRSVVCQIAQGREGPCCQNDCS